MNSKKEQGMDYGGQEQRDRNVEKSVNIGGQPAPSPAVTTSVNNKAPSSAVYVPSNTTPNPVFEDDTIPDGGYGWAVVFSVTTINAFTWGVVTS